MNDIVQELGSRPHRTARVGETLAPLQLHAFSLAFIAFAASKHACWKVARRTRKISSEWRYNRRDDIRKTTTSYAELHRYTATLGKNYSVLPVHRPNPKCSSITRGNARLEFDLPSKLNGFTEPKNG